jgi:uncharacterized protein YndB with AHSA1/START domain
MVHAGTMADGRLRNRPAPERHLPYGDALAGGTGFPEHRLLPRSDREQSANGRLPPAKRPSIPLFTAVILLEPHGASTKYAAIVIHGDQEGAKKHADMGFHDGWGKALDHLVALAKMM